MTVAGLLDRFIAALHQWSPTTLRSHDGVIRSLRADGLGRCQVDRLTPAVVQTALARWAVAGATVAVLSGRFRVLHSAISWALCERLVRSDPLVGMRSPARPYPRKHVRHELVRRLISTAERLEDKARARLVLVERPDCRARSRALFRAEQDVLLVRLAADSGARRGELAALRVDDLDGRVLSIERSAKDSVIGPTKTNRFLALDHGDGRTSPRGVEDGLVPKFVGLDRLPSLELRPPIGGHIRGFHGHGATQTAAYLGSM